MNYIVSSIVLLVIIMIIIYILSIDNNSYKLKNKLKEMFSVAGSKKINYINEKDSLLLLNFLKSHYNNYANVMIPKKIFYIKDEEGYIMKDVDIITYKFNSNTSENHTITIKFIPIKNELFIGRYTLFGMNGNYYIHQQKETDGEKEIKKPEQEERPYSEILNSSDMIPDIIHITEDSDIMPTQKKTVRFSTN